MWRNTECTADLMFSDGQHQAEVDIEVTGTHPLTGDAPVSEQFGGCGVRGKKVRIPFGILTDNVEISTQDLKESVLAVTQWRYGVFSESGVDGDPMYPLRSTAGPTETNNTGCDLNHGAILCPLDDYNRYALTKQNLLCSRQSARRSILNQFSSIDGVTFVKPNIRFVMPLDTKRVILVLDQGPTMGNIWKSILASTFQFINNLREGTELAIVSFNTEAIVHLEPTRVEGGNREGLHYRIPRRLSREDATAEMKSCLDCGIELAASMATNTTSMLLLSSYVYFDSKNNSKLMEFEQSANPIIRRLVFGSSGEQTWVHPLPDRQHNNIFLINEDLSPLNMTSEVNLALASSLNDYPSQKFHHELLPLADTIGSFSVEASLSSDLWLQLLVEDTTDINVFEIKSPSGQIFSFPKFDAGLVYFSLRGPRETGVWSYKIKLYSQKSAQVDKKLVLECWATGHAAQVQVQAWSHVPKDVSGQPVTIYTRLSQDQVPVSGAVVTAKVTPAGEAQPVTITLVDTGNGYPDITGGDGIYSGYLTQFSGEPSMYSVNIIISNNSTATVLNSKKLENVTFEAGSSLVAIEPSVPLESFKRFTTAPSFYISQGSEFYISSTSVQRRDVFPPSRITDFRLTNYFNNSLFVTLEWTAPGDDYTLGTAFRYEIRCFTAQEALTEENFGQQGILIHSSLVPSPEPSGTAQRCTVGVPWPNEVFYYSIVAFDAAGNRGEVSNSIAVFVEEPITTTNEPSTIKFSNMKDVSSTLPLKSFIESESLMYIIAGIISLILIIIVIILTVIIKRLGGCSSHKNSAATISTAPDNMSSPSLPDMCHDQYMRNSISYISGYDLPEMLEYALDSPQKPVGQELPHHGSMRARQLHSTDTSQYLGMNTSSVYQSPSIRSPVMSPVTSNTMETYSSIVPAKKSRSIATTTHKYNTVAGVTKIYTGDNGESSSESPALASPSVSPVNSNYTAGQSTDCSVSVSGSDHELISDSLQVVMLPPLDNDDDHHTNHHDVVVAPSIIREQNNLHQSARPEPKPRKIPPAVPSKTVHASLV